MYDYTPEEGDVVEEVLADLEDIHLLGSAELVEDDTAPIEVWRHQSLIQSH